MRSSRGWSSGRAVGLLSALALVSCAPAGEAPPTELDLTTWSIAAIDPATGNVGVSMASCVPNTFGDAVAALVPGVGVAATQAAWNLENRNRVYAALREGLGAQEIIDRVTAADSVTARRQYGVVTYRGGTVEVAGYTGEGASDWAGIHADPERAVTAQGNTLVSEAVVADALAAFLRDDPDGQDHLADRLMRGLEAGSAAGGDIRCNRDGLTSTAATAMILVARGGDAPYATANIGMSDQGTSVAPWLALSHTTGREGPNPVIEVRRRFDAWRAEALGADAASGLSPQVREFVAVASPHVVIRDVRLIDGTGAPARAGMSVEIRDGRIVRVGPSAEVGAPEGAEVVDGTGQTLTPGFVMLHEHLFYPSGQARYNTNEISFPPLYLAGGVTTMRTGGSVDTYTDLRVAQHVEEGRIPGPRMDVTGPYLEGPNGFVRAMPQLATPDQARAHVNFWMDQGVTSFKAYNLIDRATLRAAIEAAHARGAKVTGHLCSITYREAADLGIDNLEHGFFAATDWVADKEPDVCPRGASQTYLDLDLSSPAFTDLVRHLVDAGVAITSTLTVVERRAPGREPPPLGAQEAMLPQFRDRVMAGLAGADRPGNTAGDLLRKYFAMEKAFYDAGGLLVVGTDPTGAGDVVPGYANQRALQLLVEMGLTVEQAVEVATRNGATYLERADDIGTVEPGKRADVVLMRGDPGADPGAFRAMTLVFKDGVGYDSGKLFESVKGWVGVR
jgi:enamidase